MAESKKSIYVAIAADAGIAVSKFVAAGFSGSSSMLAEGIHSVIDAGIVSLMLVGVNRSEKPPDRRHPFGHAQELYYWTNVVALLLFSLGGGMSLLEGVNRLINPHGPESPYWSYGVLAVSAALGAYSISVAYRQLRQSQPGKKLSEAIKNSKDPRSFSVFLVDTADLLGVAIAFVGILVRPLARFTLPGRCRHHLDRPWCWPPSPRFWPTRAGTCLWARARMRRLCATSGPLPNPTPRWRSPLVPSPCTLVPTTSCSRSTSGSTTVFRPRKFARPSTAWSAPSSRSTPRSSGSSWK